MATRKQFIKYGDLRVTHAQRDKLKGLPSGTAPTFVREAIDAYNPEQPDIVLQVKTATDKRNLEQQLASAKALPDGEAYSLNYYGIQLQITNKTKVQLEMK